MGWTPVGGVAVEAEDEAAGDGEAVWPGSGDTAGWDAVGASGEGRGVIRAYFFSCSSYSCVVMLWASALMQALFMLSVSPSVSMEVWSCQIPSDAKRM